MRHVASLTREPVTLGLVNRQLLCRLKYSEWDADKPIEGEKMDAEQIIAEVNKVLDHPDVPSKPWTTILKLKKLSDAMFEITDMEERTKAGFAECWDRAWHNCVVIMETVPEENFQSRAWLDERVREENKGDRN